MDFVTFFKAQVYMSVDHCIIHEVEGFVTEGTRRRSRG